MNRLRIALIISIIAAFNSAEVFATPLYRLVDLGTLGGNSSGASRINASGIVIGDSFTADKVEHAFVYSSGKMTDLGTLGGGNADARDINFAGQIVGQSYTGSPVGFDHAFRYSGGKMTDLGTLGGAQNNSCASGINSSGQIVGQSYTPARLQHAFLYSNGVMSDLGTLGGKFSEALAINDSGQIVGDSTGPGGVLDAFLYSAGKMHDLGSVGVGSSAYGINQTGEIVGSFGLASDPHLSHAFSYSRGTTTDLGTLGGTNSYAYRINDIGQIVGDSNFAGNSGYHGFLYSDGVMRDLNSLLDASGNGWIIEGASDINNNGWIAASAFNNALARSDAVLLVPVPEPSSLVSVVVGAMAIAVGAILRRRRPFRGEAELELGR